MGEILREETDPGLTIRYPFWGLEGQGIDLAEFLRSLSMLFGEDCSLALDDVTAENVRDFISTREPGDRPKLLALDSDRSYLMLQFVRPFVEKRHKRPMYMRMSAENLLGLAELSTRYAEPEVCDALVVYRGNEVLMEYNDVGVKSAQVQIAGTVDEQQVKAFCEALELRYTREVMEE